jgi:hypothetical protein
MFGMTPMTAWELEADRRRELAAHRHPAPRQTLLSVRRDGPEASDRRLLSGWRPIRLSRWDDARP